MRNSIVVVLLAISCLLQAQEDTLRIGVSAGWSYNIIHDEAVSPMLYRGQGYAFQASLENIKTKHYDRLSLTYQHGRIQPGLDNQSMAILYRAQADWIRVFRLNSGRRLAVHTGGHFLTSLNITEHAQWVNNDVSHSIVFSLGPSLMAGICPSTIHQNLRMGWELSIPLIDYVARPDFLSALDEQEIGVGNSGILTMIRYGSVTSIHKYQRILSRVHVYWRMTSNIGLRIEYQWDYQHYSVNNVYTSANHLISTAVIYNLRKR
jgi:hypothetical protein